MNSLKEDPAAVIRHYLDTIMEEAAGLLRWKWDKDLNVIWSPTHLVYESGKWMPFCVVDVIKSQNPNDSQLEFKIEVLTEPREYDREGFTVFSVSIHDEMTGEKLVSRIRDLISRTIPELSHEPEKI